MPPEDMMCANNEKNHLRAITCFPESHLKLFEGQQLQGSSKASEGAICIHRSHLLDFNMQQEQKCFAQDIV